MPITLYGIANCDTVKKTKKLLESRKIDYIFFDYKKEAPTKEMLARWLTEFGAEKVINKRGTTWRKLSEKDQALAEGNQKQQIDLLIAHSSMIKRPIIESAKKNIIGFDKQLIENL